MEPNPNHVNAHWMLRHKVPMWTVYRPTTKDYPGKWVARMHLSVPAHTATNHLILGDTLEDVRDQLPPDLYRINRMEGDDEVIEEVWL